LSELYDNPKYYEIAFSFRDISAEVDVFEECFKRFSKIPVKSVLELSCGNGPHMEELVKRGYQYNGLDLSEAMLTYVRQKARRIGAEINLIQGNMINFTTEPMVDFVYVLLGSLFARNTSDLLSHFNSVARVLKRGGLYLLDWCIQFDQPWTSPGKDTWEIERDGIRVKTTVSWKAVNLISQTFEETIVFEIDDHGKQQTIIGRDVKRAIYPQEFLYFVSNSEHFQFIGWWNNWDLSQPLEQATEITRPIAIVQKT